MKHDNRRRRLYKSTSVGPRATKSLHKKYKLHVVSVPSKLSNPPVLTNHILHLSDLKMNALNKKYEDVLTLYVKKENQEIDSAVATLKKLQKNAGSQ